jgi:hypothetical protein
MVFIILSFGMIIQRLAGRYFSPVGFEPELLERFFLEIVSDGENILAVFF